ncbi:hypothetical protein [Brevibacillus daliensis]|uniref:hypothetical protein n=1 Tax=Brevibacillus daliensis TaxID=2892995 RepID=UPI001E2D9333|nr:hypothetical protein [Brevibacillus daliensis]
MDDIIEVIIRLIYSVVTGKNPDKTEWKRKTASTIPAPTGSNQSLNPYQRQSKPASLPDMATSYSYEEEDSYKNKTLLNVNTELETRVAEGRSMMDAYSQTAVGMEGMSSEARERALKDLLKKTLDTPVGQRDERKYGSVSGDAREGMKWALILGKPRSLSPHSTSGVGGYRPGKYQ